MCFHTSLTKTEKHIKMFYDVNPSALDVYQPYFHRSGFETDFIYIIKQNEPHNFVPSYWGIMPEDFNIYQRIGFLNKTNTLNARCENLFTSPLFSKHIKTQRCLILADGFFEPHTRNNKSYPHYIRYKNKELFAYAGIYSELDDGLYTTSIITTIANPFFKEIHNKPTKHKDHRMPLILDKSNEYDWLDSSLTDNQIKEMLFTFTSEDFEAYPVSKDVMNSRIDSNNNNIFNEVYYPELNTLF